MKLSPLTATCLNAAPLLQNVSRVGVQGHRPAQAMYVWRSVKFGIFMQSGALTSASDVRTA